MRYDKLSVALFLLFVLFMSPVLSQSDRGSIVGTVTDPNGAVVPNAKITVTNIDTSEMREVITTDEGSFTIPELKAAPYRLTVDVAGFKIATIERIQVGVQVTRRADVKLEIGGLGETVIVSSDTSVLQTESPVQQTNITERQVRELPLQIGAEAAGRSPLSFIFLDSSIVAAGGNGDQQNEAGRASGTLGYSFRVNGGQALGTEILIDGAATRRAENGTYFTEVAPGPNAFQEFTVSTAQFSAEFGNSSGGVVNFTIKSGGSGYHGEIYEFFQNEALNANIDLNNLTGIRRPVDRRNDFGFSIGGPIKLPRFGEGGKALKSTNNRAFFFFNYGGFRFDQFETVDVSVPTLRMRTGDFSEILTDPGVANFFGGPVQIFDNTVPCAYDQVDDRTVCNRPAIPGNRLDLYRNAAGQSIIDPIGANFINLFPLPNGPGVYHNYRTTTGAPSTTRYYVQKTNFVLADNHQLSFSSTYRTLTSIKGGFPRFPEPWIANGRWRQVFHSQYYRIQDDYNISSTLLNHFNAGFSRSFVQNRNTTRGLDPRSLGLASNATQNLGLPLIGFPNYGDSVTSRDPRSYESGGSTFFDNSDGDNAVQITDFVTWSRGRHTFKFGAEARWQQLNDSNHFDLGGNFNFQSNQTSNGNPNTSFNRAGGNRRLAEGWPIASLITGAPEFSFATIQSIDPGFRFFEPTFFVQDDIKVTPKLTLNIGVRYDIPYPRVEYLDRYRGFDPDAPNPAIGGRRGAIAGAANQGGVQSPYRGLIKPDYSNFSPRFGFAYKLNDKTAVRGGYGLYYSPLLYNDFGRGGQTGYSIQGGANINGRFDSFIRLNNYPTLPPVNPNSQFIGLDVEGFDKNFKTGRTAQYSFDIQRELPANFVLSLAYVGSKGTRLRSNFTPLNALPLEALRLGNTVLNRNYNPFDIETNPNGLTAADRAYAQSVGFTLPANGNAVFPGFNGTVAQSLKPFPQYNRITEHMESQGQSSYNALKVDLQRRFAQGIQVGVSYTFAKLITDAAETLFGDSPFSGVVQNPYNRKALRTVSPNVVPHSLVVNYLFELPFGKGKKFLNRGGFVDRILGGWQVSGVQRYRQGPALVPFIGGGSRAFLDLVGFGGNLRPNVTGQPFYTDNQAEGIRYQYLNLAAFSRPADFGISPGPVGSPEYAAYYADPLRFFGNAAPTYNNLRGQAFFTEDINILKKTRITETTALELRADFFNAFNRGRFALPDVNLDNPLTFGSSGRIGDINQPRHIQLAIRFIF